MYLGHFAVGLAAKPVAPKVSLGIFLVATQVIDILYAVFLVIGLNEGSEMSFDHSLVMALSWSAIALILVYVVRRDIGSAIIVGTLVLSHWVGDFISWDHILPLGFGGSPKVGLGLYNSMAVMLIMDFGLFGGGLAFYLWRTKTKDRIGKWAPWLLVAYLIALIPAAMLPGKLIIIMAFCMALTIPFGMWIDRHRSVIVPVERTRRDSMSQPEA
jgi:hypothetical protein